MYPEKLGIHKTSHFTTKSIFGTRRSMVYSLTERDYSILMHSQEFYEINIILRGEGMHYIGDSRLAVTVGDVFIIPPNFMHGYAGGKGFDVYHLLLSPAFLEKYSADLRLLPAFSALFMVEPAMRERFCSDLHLKLDPYEIATLTPLFDSITAHSDTHIPENMIIRTGEALILIAKLCSGFEKKLQQKESSSPSGGDEAFMKSIAYIYEKYYERITIDDLAKSARMSRSAYLNKFKRFTGTAPGEFILRHRIETAANMLIFTSHTVSDIASITGFYDTPHLIRAFMERMGMTPTEYRRCTKKTD